MTLFTLGFILGAIAAGIPLLLRLERERAAAWHVISQTRAFVLELTASGSLRWLNRRALTAFNDLRARLAQTPQHSRGSLLPRRRHARPAKR